MPRPSRTIGLSRGTSRREPWYLRRVWLPYISLLFLLMLPTAITTLSMVFNAHHDFKTKLADQNSLVAELAARWTGERLARLRQLAESGASAMAEGDEISPGVLATLFGNGSRREPSVGAAYILDTRGMVVGAHPPFAGSTDRLDVSQSEWYRDVSGGLKTVISAVQTGSAPAGGEVFVVATPVWSTRGDIKGFLALECGVSKFARGLRGEARVAPLLRSLMIMDRSGSAVFRGRPAGRFGPDIPDPGLVRRMLDRRRGSLEAPDPFTGELSLIGFSRTDPGGWLVTSSESARGALRTAKRLPKAFLGFGTAFFVCLFLVHFFWLGSVRRYRAFRTETGGALSYLAAIVESSRDAIIGKRMNGEVVTWNRSAELMYGYTASEAIGRSFSFLVASEKREEFDDILGGLAEGGRIDDYETTCVRKDGTRIIVSLVLSPVRSTAGGTIGISSIARDVTRRRQEDAAFQKIRLELEGKVAQLALLNRVMMDREERVLELKEQLRRAGGPSDSGVVR